MITNSSTGYECLSWRKSQALYDSVYFGINGAFEYSNMKG
jgi:hypothetical protein